MRHNWSRTLAVAALGGLFGCSPGGSSASSSEGNICGSGGDACSTSADCCTGFECANSLCEFTGEGNGGNATTGGPSSSSSGGTGSRSSTNAPSSSSSSSSGFSPSFGSSSSGTTVSSSSSSGSRPSSSSSSGRSSNSRSSSGVSSSSSGFSSSSGSGGVCDTLVSGYPATCTEGSTTCPAPTVCAFDETQDSFVCLYTCSTTADCPDTATHCVSGHCVDNGCGGEGDGGIDYPGTLNGSCDAARVDDGTCAPVPNAGFGSPGLCLQAGGTSTGDCCAWVRASQASALCETGWACTGSAAGEGGSCSELCDPNGADTCPAGESCVLQSDGETGNCQAEVADAGGGTLSDSGAATCDTTTCTGCPLGETCYCFDPLSLDAGFAACSAGNLLCAEGLPGYCE